jgi:hypothetical protein
VGPCRFNPEIDKLWHPVVTGPESTADCSADSTGKIHSLSSYKRQASPTAAKISESII